MRDTFEMPGILSACAEFGAR